MKRYIFLVIVLIFMGCKESLPTRNPKEKEIKFALDNISLVAARAKVGLIMMPYCETKLYKEKDYIVCVNKEYSKHIDRAKRRAIFYVKKVKTEQKLNYGSDDKSELGYFPLIVPLDDESIFFMAQGQNINPYLDDNNGMLYSTFKSQVPKKYSAYEPNINEVLKYAAKAMRTNPEYIIKNWYAEE